MEGEWRRKQKEKEQRSEEEEALHGGASTPPKGLQPMEEPTLEHRKKGRRKELWRETNTS